MQPAKMHFTVLPKLQTQFFYFPKHFIGKTEVTVT